MHRSKVKVAFRRHISYIRCYLPLFAKFPDRSRCGRVINSRKNHVDIIEIRGLEFAVMVGNLAFLDSVSHLGIQACAWRDDSDFGVGIEDV